jgi:hypothetical protein
VLELVIPFRVRGHDGAVHVEYGINEDPQRWGNRLLGVTEPLNGAEVGRGFPLCRATVTFAGEGYAAVMAWIQMLRFSGATNGVLVDQSAAVGRLRHALRLLGAMPLVLR